MFVGQWKGIWPATNCVLATNYKGFLGKQAPNVSDRSVQAETNCDDHKKQDVKEYQSTPLYSFYIRLFRNTTYIVVYLWTDLYAGLNTSWDKLWWP